MGSSAEREVYRRAADKCEICGDRGPKWPIECHEIWEYDEDKGIQRLVRLEALCPACHEVKHIGFAEVKGRFGEAMEHLCSVNGCSKVEGQKMVAEAFEVWNRRSGMQWKLDLSYLEKFWKGK